MVFALSACGATIPESGPVVEGPAVDAASDSQFIRVIARPPIDGATPVEVVQGFLEASASSQDDYAVARQYLTSTASLTWSPAAQTSVYDGSSVKLAVAGATNVIMTAPLVGRIDAAGSATVAEPGRAEQFPFKVSREAGQWRISAPPPGLLLTQGDVERAYRTYNAYFFDPQFTALVPDPITLPATGSGVATALMRRLLAGPTDWLAPAVRTAFPSGATLAVDSVPIENGIAQVNLDPRVLASGDSTRAALSAQIVWTLEQVPEVIGVRITAGGVPLPVPGQSAIQYRDAWPAYNPDAPPADTSAFVLTSRGIVRAGGTTPGPVIGPPGTPKQPISAIAVSADGSRISALSTQRTSVVESQGNAAGYGAFRVRATGTAMTSVGFGADNSLWWVDSAGVHTLDALSNTPQPVAVEGTEGPGAGRVVGIAVARDGTRAALLMRRGPRTEVRLVRVERRGETVRLAAPRRVDTRISAAVDVAWSSATELAVLGSDGAGPLEVFTVSLGSAPLRFVATPPLAVSVAAAPTLDVLVGTSDSTVWAYHALEWRELVSGTSPTYAD